MNWLRRKDEIGGHLGLAQANLHIQEFSARRLCNCDRGERRWGRGGEGEGVKRTSAT